MRFVGGDSHASALQRFEALVSGVPVLASFVLDVEVYPSFATLGQATTHAHKESAAGYLSKSNRLAINEEVFQPLNHDLKMAVLGHEVGHAYRHRADLSAWGAEDCYEADALAIAWGVGDELIADRERRYGGQYASILRAIQRGTTPPDKLLAEYRAWQTRRNAGIE